MDWFTLLIGCGLLMAIIAVLVIVDTYFELQTSSNDTVTTTIPAAVTTTIPTTNTTTNSSNLDFKNTVIINNKRYHNEATEYARSLLITSLLSNKHDTISQYMPVHLYSRDMDITDKFEYHSLIEVKGIAIVIRLLLANNSKPLSIDQLIVKSQEGKDLFILEQELQIEPYQYLYLVWYIQLAGDNITEQGIAQLLTALAYGNTQYKHSTLKDVVLLDEKGNILPFYPLAFKIEIERDNNDNKDNDGNSNNTININAILKNNTAKDLSVKTIAVRNTALDYIFAYDLEEALLARAYSKIAIKVEIES